MLIAAIVGARWWSQRPSAAPPKTGKPTTSPTPARSCRPPLASTRPLFYDAVTQYQAGHYPAALHTLGRISPPALGADTILYYRGIFLLRQGQGRAAEPYLRRLSEEDSSTDLARRARYHLGMAYWQAQELPAALTTLREVAADSLNPYRRAARRVIAAKLLETKP